MNVGALLPPEALILRSELARVSKDEGVSSALWKILRDADCVCSSG
jgi:hypothetical protein